MENLIKKQPPVAVGQALTATGRRTNLQQQAQESPFAVGQALTAQGKPDANLNKTTGLKFDSNNLY